MTTDIGTKVTVTFPHYGHVTRILREDGDGLYVKYQGHRVSVRPDSNALGEVVHGYYIGKHPKIQA
jgi:hypothetical protein